MRPADWAAVRAVYAEGIATGQATFDERPPSWDEWDRSPVSLRPVYRGVAEVSLYVAAADRGSGVGRTIGEALVQAAEGAGVWTLEGLIFPENRASLALCEALGCRVVGVRERLGRMGGRWRDVVLVERRSSCI
jgi:phosphinothricin acetyltransferase